MITGMFINTKIYKRVIFHVSSQDKKSAYSKDKVAVMLLHTRHLPSLNQRKV